MATQIGIDLGSSKTVIFSNSKIVLEQPSVVTVESESYEPVFYGDKAKQTIGRTPESYLCINPIENGVISDYDIAQMMLKKYMDDVFGNKVIRPQIMATLPPGVTELQHHSLINVVEDAGGRNITVIESPLAIACGLEIDFKKPHGELIIDIGAGTTDIAVISMGGIAVSDSAKISSTDFDNQIIRYIRKEYNIEIGPLTAEFIKKQIGTVNIRQIEVAITAKGRNVFTGLPETFEITSDEVREIIMEPIDSICKAISSVLSKADPDLVSDIKRDGFYLTGGGSQLIGLPEYVANYLGSEVHTLDDPSHSVVRGAAAALSHPEKIKGVNYQLRSIKELQIN